LERSDFYILVWLTLAFLAMMILTAFIPPPWGRWIGGIVYFTVMFGGILGQDVLLQYMAARYPYIRAVVRPMNRTLHLYIQSYESEQVWRNSYTTRIQLGRPINTEGLGENMPYGQVDSIVIEHDREWAKRLAFKPGRAVYAGCAVNHPQVEHVELYTVESGTISIDRAEMEPVFHLQSATQDYYSPPTPIRTDGKGRVLVSAADLQRVKHEMSEAKRQAHTWHQQALAYEEIIDQQKSELKGLLEAKGGTKHLSVEYLLTLCQYAGSIEKARKMVEGPKFTFQWNKFVVYTVIGLAVIAYLWANPEAIETLVTGLNSPIGVIIVIASAIVAYYVLVKKKT
jgi:hypothetical protein